MGGLLKPAVKGLGGYVGGLWKNGANIASYTYDGSIAYPHDQQGASAPAPAPVQPAGVAGVANSIGAGANTIAPPPDPNDLGLTAAPKMDARVYNPNDASVRKQATGLADAAYKPQLQSIRDQIEQSVANGDQAVQDTAGYYEGAQHDIAHQGRVQAQQDAKAVHSMGQAVDHIQGLRGAANSSGAARAVGAAGVTHGANIGRLQTAFFNELAGAVRSTGAAQSQNVQNKFNQQTQQIRDQLASLYGQRRADVLNQSQTIAQRMTQADQQKAANAHQTWADDRQNVLDQRNYTDAAATRDSNQSSAAQDRWAAYIQAGANPQSAAQWASNGINNKKLRAEFEKNFGDPKSPAAAAMYKTMTASK